jgi:hypothetical protein
LGFPITVDFAAAEFPDASGGAGLGAANGSVSGLMPARAFMARHSMGDRRHRPKVNKPVQWLAREK